MNLISEQTEIQGAIKNFVEWDISDREKINIFEERYIIPRSNIYYSTNFLIAPRSVIILKKLFGELMNGLSEAVGVFMSKCYDSNLYAGFG